MTKIKFCGLSRRCDIEAVNELKPEYIGFVFVKTSKRYVSFEKAEELKSLLDPKIKAVGVFVNEDLKRIEEICDKKVIDIVQLHGLEEEKELNYLRSRIVQPVIKAFCIKKEEDVRQAERSPADFILLDSGAGTGRTFEWEWIKHMERPYFLAGGIHIDNVEKALEQLKLLSSAYKEKYNKIHFLQSLMTDSIPTYNVYDRAARLHIAPEEPRILYLLETSHSLDEDISEILKNLFPSQSGAFRIPLTEASCAILCPVRSLADSSQETVHLTARMIVDTVNAEALARVRVSYSKTLHNLLDLSTAFRETSLALKVGKLFYSEQTVFPYNRLGIGRLIYRLPTSLCENFLHEIFGEEIPQALDEETTATVNKFLQNNLNIAETSRQLHMHRNTLIYRLEQIEKRTGLDLRQFEDAMTFKIASMVMNYLYTERNTPHE